MIIIVHNIVYIIGSLFLIGVGISLVHYYSLWYIFIICFGIVATILTTIWLITVLYHLKYFALDDEIKEQKIKKIQRIEKWTLNFIAW
ncbi:hypothetical protein SPE_0913 [Spiroplasma eriocheiris CCTCC M 207170]|nr:hypothetical protein SPE_0913 [Spiroplasma eriocheiris CCTCC M 207170]